MRNLILFLAACALPAQDPSFVVLADPQFGMYTNNGEFSQETANLEFAVANINRWKPAFVIVCGDLINKPGDAAQTAEYHRIMGLVRKDVPVYHVAGNHDTENEPTPAALATYRRDFGRDYYSFRSGGLYGIVLNSSLIAAPAKAAEEAARQEEWFRQELAKAKAAAPPHLVVFLHHPLFLKDSQEPDQYFTIPRAARLRYMGLMKEHGVRYVFAGHLHRDNVAVEEGFHVITSAPVGKPLGSASSGLRVATVHADGIEQRFYPLGNLPNQLGAKK